MSLRLLAVDDVVLVDQKLEGGGGRDLSLLRQLADRSTDPTLENQGAFIVVECKN